MSPRASVILVTYHTGPVLFHTIDRVLEQSGLEELIIIDNGNPEGVVSALREKAGNNKTIQFITGHGNIGFAAACNRGAGHATGEYILLLNPDCLLAANALALTMQAMEETGAMLAGGRLLNPDGTDQRGSRRQLLTPQTALTESLGLHRFMRVKRLNDHETPMPAHTHEVPAISGAYMCMRARDYRALGGMDEGYFLHVEDLDLCMRVQQAGGKTICVPGARAIHLLSTSDASSAFVEWSKAKGFFRYFDKHFAGTSKCMLLGVKTGAVARFMLKTGLSRWSAGGLSAAARAGKKTLLLLEAMRQAPLAAPTYVAISGASSALGARIAGRLLASGARVRALSRAPDMALDIAGLNWYRADLEHGEVPKLSSTDFIHCAPLWSLPPALDALSREGITRIVAFGSTSVFGKQNSIDAKEQEVVARLREAETQIARSCEALGIAFTILRPTLIYGAGLDGNVTRLAGFIRRFRFLPIVPPAWGLRQPVHIDDLAEAALTALSTPVTQRRTYNVSGGETLTYRAMCERIFTTLGVKPRFLPLPFLPQVLDALARLAKTSRVSGEMARRMNRDLTFSHEEAARDFGYHPRPFLSGGMKDINGL